MGTGLSKKKDLRSRLDPPFLHPKGDLQYRQKEVFWWVDLIKHSALSGPDRVYKTIFVTLGRVLYDRGLPSAQQSIADEAQAKKIIEYKQEDQIAAVADIVELIAGDPPSAVVTRLINSYNRVTTCRRKKNEDLSIFVSRFCGLAAEHLMHSNVTSGSKIA